MAALHIVGRNNDFVHSLLSVSPLGNSALFTLSKPLPSPRLLRFSVLPPGATTIRFRSFCSHWPFLVRPDQYDFECQRAVEFWALDAIQSLVAGNIAKADVDTARVLDSLLERVIEVNLPITDVVIKRSSEHPDLLLDMYWCISPLLLTAVVLTAHS